MSCNNCDSSDIGQEPVTKEATFSVGDDYSFMLRYRQSGDVVDLTDYSFAASLEKEGEDSVELSISKDIENGTVTFLAAHADTAGMSGGDNRGDPAAQWYINVVETNPDGYVRRIMHIDVYVLE